MGFKPQESLTEAEIQNGLQDIIRDGVASQAMGVLTGGAFLIAFAVKLGASNLVIGLLAAIGPLSQLLQLPSIFLVEKVRNRRLIAVVAAGLSRLCWLIIALSPFIFPAGVAIVVLLILLIAVSAFGAISGCSWNSWMRDLIPENIMGSFFSKRMRIATGVGIVLSSRCCLSGLLEKAICRPRTNWLFCPFSCWFFSRSNRPFLFSKDARNTNALGSGKT